MTLKSNCSLAELQRYVAAAEKERGFAAESTVQKCLLLGEEVGELFKAVRRASGLGVDSTSRIGEIGEELADVLLFLLAIANRCGVDLETALREKVNVNSKRVWHSDPPVL